MIPPMEVSMQTNSEAKFVGFVEQERGIDKAGNCYFQLQYAIVNLKESDALINSQFLTQSFYFSLHSLKLNSQTARCSENYES